MQVDKNHIKKQVEVLKKLCLLVTDNEEEFEAGRIFLSLDYQEALFDIIEYTDEQLTIECPNWKLPSCIIP